MVPSGWSFKKLEEANITITDGDRGKEYPKSTEFSDSGYCLFLSAKNVSKNGFSFSETQFISETKHKKLRKGIVNKGDIVLTTRGTVGQFAYYNAAFDYAAMRINSGMVTLNCSEAELSSDFFYALSKSSIIKKQIDSAAFGSAQPQLTVKIIKSLKLPIPPLPEQRKIASILGTWDKAISTTERLIDNSKQQKKALMQQLLTGKKRLLDDSGKPFEGELQRLSMSDLATIDKESLGKKTPDNFEFNYISLSDVETGRISKRLEKHVFDSSPSRARRIVRNGDILLATVRPNLKGFAKAEELHDGMIASTGFSVLSPKKNVSGSYLYHYLFSCHLTGQINALVVGSNYPAINSSDVGGLKIYCPSYSEQQKISSVLNNADGSIKTLEQQLADLKQEKKALMQQLLTGKRRVTIDEAEVA